MDTSIQGISTSVNGINTSIQGIGWNLHSMDGSVQRTPRCARHGVTAYMELRPSLQEINSSIQTINTAVRGIPVMNDAIQKFVFYVEKVLTCRRQNPDKQSNGQERKPYKLGQDIFYYHHQFTTNGTGSQSKNSPSIPGLIISNKAVVTDDGHVACINYDYSSIEIYDTDSLYVGTIQLQSEPWDITVFNNCTVAVTKHRCQSIDILDIHNKQEVKSIQLSTACFGITTKNNKLVVGCGEGLLIIDPQTEKVEKTIETGDCIPRRLCGSHDSIFYTDGCSNYLYHYNIPYNKFSKVKLPSGVSDVTTLQDGSVYAACYAKLVLHVSSDGQKYKKVTTKGLASLGFISKISFNPIQKKLVMKTRDLVTVYQQT